MTRPDLMIFDCDGVLVDSEVLSCACPCDAVARCGIELGVPEASEGVHGRA